MAWSSKYRRNTPVEEREEHLRKDLQKKLPKYRKLGLEMIDKIRKEQGWK